MANTLGFECINAGVNKWASGYADYKEKIEYTLNNMNPDIMFISSGMYDITVNKLTAEQIEAYARECYQYVKDNAPNVKLITIGLNVPGETVYGWFKDQFDQVNDKLKNLSLEFKVPYIDLLKGEIYDENGNILTQNSELVIHDSDIDSESNFLTIEGNKRIGELLAGEVIKILGNEYVIGGGESTLSYEVTIDYFSEDIGNKTITNIAEVNNKQTNEATIDVQKDTSKKVIIESNKTVKTESGESFAKEGEELTYEIGITNEGNVPASVKVQDTIPSGTDFIPGSIKINGESTHYTKNDLENGEVEVTINPGNVSLNNNVQKEMQTKPTVTCYQDDATQVTSCRMYPASIDGAVNPIFTSYNSQLTVNGGFPIIGQNCYYSDAQIWPNNYSIEFTANCKYIYINIYTNARIWVDEGNGYEIACDINAVQGTENSGYYKIEFNDKAKRNIKIDLSQAFSGVWVSSEDEITAIERTRGERIVFIGDSWTAGNEVISYNSYSNQMALMLGMEAINGGTGGTGYIATGANYCKYADRLEHELVTFELNPEIVVIAGGLNDILKDYAKEDIIREAGECYQKAKELAPESKIIIIGMNSPKGKEYADQKMLEVNEGLKDLALSLELPYIDMLNGNTYAEDGTLLTTGKTYFTGSGCLGNEQNNGNADNYISADTIHPTIEGHKYLAGLYAEELQKILNYSQRVIISFKVQVKSLSEEEKTKEIQNTARVNNTDTNIVKTEVVKENDNSNIIGKKKAILENGETYAKEGDTITYEIELTNNGDIEETIKVKDTIPQGTSFVDKSIEINGIVTEYTRDDLENKGIDIPVPPVNADAKEMAKILNYQGIEVNNIETSSAKATLRFKVQVNELPKDQYSSKILNIAYIGDDGYTNIVTTDVKKTQTEEDENKKIIEVTKTWNDDKNEDKRPQHIKIVVKRDGKQVDEKIIGEQEGWKWTFILPKYDEETGEEIQYTVDEVAVKGQSLKSYNKVIS